MKVLKTQDASNTEVTSTYSTNII